MTTRKKTRSANYKVAPLELTTPRTSAIYIDEPELLFAEGNRHCDPRTGIPLYGPRSLGTSRHKSEVHVGFITLRFSRLVGDVLREVPDGQIPDPKYKYYM